MDVRPMMISVAAMAIVFAGIAAGQSALSAHAGLLNYVEGRVTVAGKPAPALASLPHVPKGQDLRTARGRAEVLLNSGAFLRVAEYSAFRLLSNGLTETRVEALAGTFILEYAVFEKESHVTFVAGPAVVTFRRKGIYLIRAEDALVRVYAGEAVVVRNGEPLTLKSGAESRNGDAHAAREFQPKTRDAFFNWCVARSEYVGMTTCFAAARIEDPSRLQNFSATYGSVPLLAPYYCRRFLGPLALLRAGGP